MEVSGARSIGERELERFDLGGVSRLLIKTGSWGDPDVFPEEIVYLRPDVAPLLARKGVRLVGVEPPSVDPLASKELPAHHALTENGVHILEGILLDGIQPGDYELIALPLALRDADGSPVRAVLRRTDYSM